MKIIKIIVLILALTMLGSIPVRAGTRYYKANGTYIGSGVRTGEKTTYHNSNGTKEGYSIQVGDTERYYTNAGTYVGKEDYMIDNDPYVNDENDNLSNYDDYI